MTRLRLSDYALCVAALCAACSTWGAPYSEPSALNPEKTLGRARPRFVTASRGATFARFSFPSPTLFAHSRSSAQS